MSNEAKQRFLALDVVEVSVVDTPANEVEFLVVKRMNQETKMSAENAPTTVTQAQVDVAKGLEAAMANVATLVENIAKQATASNAATEEAADVAADAAVEKSSKGKGEVRKNYRTTLKSAGITGEQYRAALKAFDSTLTPDSPETKVAEVAPVTKAAAPVADGAITDALTQIATLTETVQKAKTLTPSRAEAFQTALATLKGLLEEMIQIPQGTMPATNTPAISTSPGSTVNLTKALEDLTSLVTKTLEGQQDVAKRLEIVEKTRGTGNAIPNDETGKPVEKKVSLWGNVI